jgi:L-ribulose-5-phosphate 3-epimerase
MRTIATFTNFKANPEPAGYIIDLAPDKFLRRFLVIATSRRQFLSSAVAIGLCSRRGFAEEGKLRIGVTDWSLNLDGNPDAMGLAASLGFDGVQISFGQKLVDGKLPMDNPEVIANYLSLSKEHGIRIDGTSMDQHTSLDPKWMLDSIRLTRALNTTVLELPFFGPSAIKTKTDMEHAGDVLRDLAPEAAKAGVILGLENALSAEDNARIIERSGTASVKVFYDVGNSTAAGFDPAKEIRWLGRERICQFHFKDNPHYLGEGNIQFAPIVQAIRDIYFVGYANLETNSPSGKISADMSRNLTYIRKVIAQP